MENGLGRFATERDILSPMNALVGWMEGVLDWLKIGVALILWGWFLVVLPLIVFRRTRSRGATLLVQSSYYTAFSCWWFCFILCYRVFGGVWLFVGLLGAGIGVIPLAFFGLMIKSFWTPGLGPWVLDTFAAIMLFAVPRWLGLWILVRIESNAAKSQEQPEVLPASYHED